MYIDAGLIPGRWEDGEAQQHLLLHVPVRFSDPGSRIAPSHGGTWTKGDRCVEKVIRDGITCTPECWRHTRVDT